jgi:hypothetical protein
MIKPSVLRAMLAAGATAEMLVAAVEADYNAGTERRERATERQRRHRMSRVTGCDTPAPSPPMINNSSTPPSPTQNKSIKTRLEEPLFDEFWGVYPLKVGKGAARKAYRHALTRASSAEILAGAKRYAASKPEPKFTAHPTTWLNADRWLDEAAKPSSNVSLGPWKPFTPENDPPKPPPEERERQVISRLKQLRPTNI